MHRQLPSGPTEHTDIFFSPHLDDAALSCGGTIALQRSRGAHVLVVSAFTGEPDPSRRLNEALVPFSDMPQRREEDLKAMERLQADHLWLGYEEAIHRHRRYQSMIGLTSRVLDEDRPLQGALWADLVGVCDAAKAATLYFPLAVGNHVDHQILFDLGVRAEEAGRRVRYYEDAPYAFIHGLLQIRLKAIGAVIQADLLPRDLRGGSILQGLRHTRHDILRVHMIRTHLGPVQKALLLSYVLYRVLIDVHLSPLRPGRVSRRCLVPRVLDVTEHLPAKLGATQAYRSQVATLFGDVEAFRDAVQAYSAAVLGKEGRCVERYWESPEPTA